MRQFLDLIKLLTTESNLKIMKNTFYFILKVLFIFRIFTFLPWLFGDVGKQLDMKVQMNLKIHGVADWIINNYIISRRKDNQAMKFVHLI